MFTKTHKLVIAAAVAFAAATPAFAAFTSVPLTASGNQSYSANSTNTLFSLNDIQPAGSGVWGPIVRLENTGSEQGYNVDFPHTNDKSTMDVVPLDHSPVTQPVVAFNTVVDKNHDINLALDYNEPGSAGKSGLSLINLVLVVSTNAGKFGPAETNPWGIEAIPADAGDITLYDMSTTTDNGSGTRFEIDLDANDNLASGNGGSGQADLGVKIHLGNRDLTNLFDGNHYLYVYSLFGGADANGPDSGSSNPGYEEWRVSRPNEDNICLDCGGATPEPASIGVLGLGAIGLMVRRRKA